MGEDEQQPSLFGDAASGPVRQSRQAKAARGPEADDAPDRARPLAARMRPRTLDEVLGQDHLLAPGHALRRALERDQVPSMILWGPPGSGKTTLASVIAASTHARFVALSAVTAGVADLRRVVEDAAKLQSPIAKALHEMLPQFSTSHARTISAFSISLSWRRPNAAKKSDRL
jgi:putative ATPase